MIANGGFSFSNAVSMSSTLNVLLATTCAALSCTGFTCSGNLSVTGAATLQSTLTWGGVTYVAPTSTNTGSTYPTLLSITTDGVTEVGKFIDFHSDSAQASEDFTVRLSASSTVLNCNTAFTSLKHAGTAYPIEAFTVQNSPVQLPLDGVKDVYGNVATVADLSLRTNFTGWFQVHAAWEVTSSNATAHRTELRKNGIIVARSRVNGGGQLSYSLNLLSSDTLAVWISLPDAIAPNQVDVDETKTYFSIVQV